MITSQIVFKPQPFHGKTINFQNWGHPLKTYPNMIDFTTTTPTPYRDNHQNLGYLLPHCESCISGFRSNTSPPLYF